MEINICYLYKNQLNAYGDYGNAMILKYRCNAREIVVNETDNISQADIVIIGSGPNSAFSRIKNDLLLNRADELRNYVDAGKCALFVGWGYALACEYKKCEDETIESYLGILPAYFVDMETRVAGYELFMVDGVVHSAFANHGRKVYTTSPFGTVVKGFGNNGEDGTTGCICKNAIGSHLHGPLLGRNPHLADDLLRRALNHKYGEVTLRRLDDYYENMALEVDGIINK